jgi:hypothetical protein
LNDGLTYALEARDFENFQGMVNKALMLENHRGVMERKRKLMHQHQSNSSSRPRVATSSTRPVFCPVSVEATGNWTRTFNPTVPSDIVPQQFPDPCCW